MSYKIEITADTITELTGKLLALAAATQPSAVDPVMPEVKELTETTKAHKTKSVRGSTAVEAAAEQVDPDKQNAAGGNPTSETSPQPSDTSNVSASDTTSEGTTTNSAASPEATQFDFDKDVAPVVLNAVKNKGREWVQEILSQFGVERASQVPDEQLGELIDAIKAGDE